ncbi:MAG: 50S ribosomal protein L32 [Candidatus Zixiibacteriota bacterium]|nr:MAG: 50S ribosomal protein L32 [candidate division Zixibacteria bacterium]
MALPKRRHSRSRGAKRRTHWKLEKPGIMECPHCHEPKLPHQICPSCGWYKGREVVAITESK